MARAGSPDDALERAAADRLGGCVPAKVCGIDEAGRGPLAGPVTAAAVILDPADIPSGLADSKILSPARRNHLRRQIEARAEVGLGFASVREIEDLNILQATLLAMQRAVANLPVRPGYALVDGNRLPELPCPAEAIVKGDSKSVSIAAASIIAKENRDAVMRELAAQFPGYGWQQNMGYGTRGHREALERLGVTPHHRRTFGPVKALLDFRLML